MYTVVRQPKSVGIALLLTFLFGPIGLFYASVTGALVMIFGPLALLILLFSTLHSGAALFTFLGSMIVYGLLGWLVCIIWAVIAVNAYNRKLILGSIQGSISPLTDDISVYSPDDEVSTEVFQENKRRNPSVNIVIALCLATITYLLYDKYKPTTETKTGWSVSSNALMYSSPNVKSSVIGNVSEGQSVEIIRQTVYFMKVRFIQTDGSTSEGFIQKQFVKDNSQSSATSTQINLVGNDPVSSNGLLLSQSMKWADTEDIEQHNITSQTDEEPQGEAVYDMEPGLWQVNRPKAYFYKWANIKDRTNAYLIMGDIVSSSKGSKKFLSVLYTNKEGKTTSGFVMRGNLDPYDTEPESLQEGEQ